MRDPGLCAYSPRRPSRAYALYAILVLLGVTAFTPAMAQRQACGQRSAIIETLDKDYNEAPAWIGTLASGHLELLLSVDQQSWSLLLILPSGQACLHASGEAWQWAKPRDPGAPS